MKNDKSEQGGGLMKKDTSRRVIFTFIMVFIPVIALIVSKQLGLPPYYCIAVLGAELVICLVLLNFLVGLSVKFKLFMKGVIISGFERSAYDKDRQFYFFNDIVHLIGDYIKKVENMKREMIMVSEQSAYVSDLLSISAREVEDSYDRPRINTMTCCRCRKSCFAVERFEKTVERFTKTVRRYHVKGK